MEQHVDSNATRVKQKQQRAAKVVARFTSTSLKQTVMHLSKYKQNLKVENGFVVSYNTRVARIEGDKLIQLGWWSVTTQKHINFAASELNLTLVRNEAQ